MNVLRAVLLDRCDTALDDLQFQFCPPTHHKDLRKMRDAFKNTIDEALCSSETLTEMAQKIETLLDIDDNEEARRELKIEAEEVQWFQNFGMEPYDVRKEFIFVLYQIVKSVITDLYLGMY